MKPNDTFTYLKNNRVSHDMTSLTLYYLPIIGAKATAVYATLFAFYNGGHKPLTFHTLLNHLNMGMAEFEEALHRLMAVHLIALGTATAGYELALSSPMDAQGFFKHQVMVKLLEKQIGRTSLEALRPQVITEALPVAQQVSDFFGEPVPKPAQTLTDNDFDLVHFKQLMARDQLRFADEAEAVPALFQYATRTQKNWYETYQMAKETAVGQVISPKRLLKTLTAEQPPLDKEFKKDEQTLLRWAKSRTCLEFLADIKQARQASITTSERQLLKELAGLGLLDPVINVLVLYTFNKVDSANLNETYARKLGNDLSYQGIGSAEAALLYLKNTKHTKGKSQAKQTAAKSNVPEWSQEAYVTEATAEELAHLEALRLRMQGDKEK